MEFYEAIKNRRTVRDWAKKEVSQAVLNRILWAGLQAPSNDHLRNWEFIILHSEEEKENALQFVKSWADKQKPSGSATSVTTPASKMYTYAMPRQYTMLKDAPYVIIPVFKAGANVLGATSINQLNSFASIWCVIENIFLAASAESLACSMRIPVGKEGTCVAAALKLPPEYLVPCYIGIGYPKDGDPVLEQNTHEIQQKMHFGTW